MNCAQTIGAVILALIISFDALAVAFAYGCKRIEIPLSSVCIISVICTGTLGLAFMFGSVINPFVPEWIATGLSFTILFLIGIIKLLDSIVKTVIRKHTKFSKEIELSIFNLKFLMKLYADPEEADIDVSRSIEPKESILLAIPVSLDGFAVGFGAALMGFNGWVLILFSLFTNGMALWLGGKIGCVTAKKIPFNVSWLAGLILIALAFLQIL